jgi:membrane protease YdiL (CAAX protease family)
LYFFLTGTFLWSWAIWIPTVWLHGGKPLDQASTSFYIGLLAGAYGPSVMAIAVTALSGGKTEVRQLFSKFLVWRVGLRWYAVVLLLHPALRMIGILVLLLRGGDIGRIDPTRWYLIPLALVAAAPFGPLAEELGWRGFALPRLLRARGAIESSLVLGVVWFLWHVPLFWAPAGTIVSGAPVTIRSVGLYLLFLVLMSILFTWVYRHTRGSLLLAYLFHLSLTANAYFVFLPELTAQIARTAASYSLLPLLVVVALVLLFDRAASTRAAPGQTQVMAAPPFNRRSSARESTRS